MVLLLLFIGPLVSNRLQSKYYQFSKHLEILASIFKELATYYVEEIDYDKLVKTGLDTMLSSLDSYTTFLSETDLESFQAYTTGEYGGIGAIIGKRKEQATVVVVYKDSPAYKGGLRVGDEICQVNGEDVSESAIEHISSLLTGMPSTSVQLSAVRDGVAEPLTFTLTREQIILKNVLYYGHIQQGIGYIKLSSFKNHVADEVQTALASLKEEGVQKLILDLRGNPGGILEEAIKVANLFIEQHLVVVTTKGNNATLDKTYTTLQPAYDTEVPIIVLIDQHSASAAEIIAGVMQDYDRAVLMGNRTFGKGFVQTTRPLRYNTQLKLTTSRYYLPSGRSIQKIERNDCQNHKHATAPHMDATQQIFLTRARRKVESDHGIAPDLEVDRFNLAPITVSLLEQGFIFDYATQFQAQNDHIAAVQDFMISSDQYNDFVTWLEGKNYAYTIESSIDQLIKQAQHEAYPAGLKAQIIRLKSQVQDHKKEDLQRFKKEIKLMLQEEIVTRYYFQEGAIEAMLVHDQLIKQACLLFSDMDRYHSYLKNAA